MALTIGRKPNRCRVGHLVEPCRHLARHLPQCGVTGSVGRARQTEGRWAACLEGAGYYSPLPRRDAPDPACCGTPPSPQSSPLLVTLLTFAGAFVDWLRAFEPVKNPIKKEKSHAPISLSANLSFTIVRAEYETAAGHAPLFAMPFHNAVQIISRSSPMHCLERRLVRFLRLHRATLGLFSCLIPEGCGPDPAGFSGPYSSVLCHPFEGHCVVDCQRLIRPQPHSRHSSQHPAPSWVSA